MNFTPKITLLLSLSLTIIVSCFSLIETTSCSSLPLRKVSVYSQLFTEPIQDLVLDTNSRKPINFTQDSAPKFIVPHIKDTFLRVDSVLRAPKTRDTLAPQPNIKLSSPDNITLIEDYSTDGYAMAAFYSKLRSARSMSRPVRIAVLGDSFIEGDIFTQDLRELMQDNFGGRGVGYVPITSIVAGFRQSVAHTFSGWTTSSMSKVRKGAYTMSSFLYNSTPLTTSTVNYRMTNYRRHLGLVSKTRFIFTNTGVSTIKATINGTETRVLNANPSDKLLAFAVDRDSIKSITFSVQGDGKLTSYGAFLESANGVIVDNYSMRGNSGTGMSSIDRSISEQLDFISPVDMIIFEYGLNVVQSEAKSYTDYCKQMKRAIAHVSSCFPNAVILVMGVPDRTRRNGDDWVTIPGVQVMANMQRQLAQDLGLAYWSTMDAMRNRGGMNKFVDRGWAAKDFTHLSTRGGKEIGIALFDAFISDMKNRGL